MTERLPAELLQIVGPFPEIMVQDLAPDAEPVLCEGSIGRQPIGATTEFRGESQCH